MALFDIFKRRKAESEQTEQTNNSQPQEQPAVEVDTPTNKQEEIDEGLKKTKEGFFGKLARAVAGRSQVDVDFLDELAFS